MNTAPRSLRLGFAGTPEFAVPALEALLGSRHPVAAVFTQPDRPAGRGQILHRSAVKRRAQESGLRVEQPSSFKGSEALTTLADLALDALVVVAYGLILPAAALALPRLGCFNIHASLLPRWRGAAPIQRAILAGDAETGVTIMRMEAGLDTGPGLCSRKMPIGPRATGGAVHDALATLGGELIVAALDGIVHGTVHENPQPSVGVTYAEKINKSEALIDWHGSAVHIDRQIRAFNPWPVAETRLHGVQLRIWDAELSPMIRTAAPPGRVLGASGAGIDVACGDGILRIRKLQLAGRKPLDAAEFLKAQRVDGVSFGRP